ncbi:hypothetical protein BSPA111_42820 [Buttiauxella sp. A111]|nr:hypothetical protein BSPA111_42820 [Buttiauxella sp. A111]
MSLIKSIFTGLVMTAAVVTTAQADVTIKGNNKQTVNVQGAVANSVVGAASKAKQSLASNVGNVTVKGNNTQTIAVQGAVANSVVGAASTAEQHLGSNVGN